MNNTQFIYAIIGGFLLGVLNSWFWYKRGYRGGKLLFMGTIGFTGIIILLLSLTRHS